MTSKKLNTLSRLNHAVHAAVEHLENRCLMSGDASIVQALPYTLEFSSAASGVTDQNGTGTGFSWVQPNRAGNEYQPNLISLDTTAGVLKLTTTGNASAGGSWETDNSLANGLNTQFDATTGAFTITTRLVGPLSYIKDPSEQAGITFGPDQDNYVKLVAVATPNGQFLQFVDEQKATGATSYTHAIGPNGSYTSIGSFANVQTLDLMISGNISTGLVTGYFRVNGGAVQQLAQSVTLTGAEKSAFFNSAAQAGLIAMAKNNLAPITAIFDRFAISAGSPTVSTPSVNASATTPGNGATDVWRDASITAALNLPNVGHGVNASTLTSSTVQLYRTSDHTMIAGHSSTSGAGDTITFQPSSPLDANTQYTFSVTSGVKDTSGTPFQPYSESFTTGTNITAVDPNIAFEQVQLPTAQGQIYTAVTVGPDHKLYAATLDGLIQRFTINADGTLGAAQNIKTVQIAAGTNRTITGLTFDPSSTSSNLILWISNNQYAPENATDWTGKISKLTGADLQNIQDYVTGLPRSVRDHMTNQIAFGPDGAMYVSQGSNSAMGAPDPVWGERSEHLLNAAILRVDVHAIDARLAAGQGPLNVQTEGLDANNYNPYAPGAALTIYATGVRNAYDLVWTRAGQLFAATNGSAAGANTPAYPTSVFSSQRIDGTTWTANVPALTNVNQTEDDFLYNITQGGYYGHPDPARGEYVMDGGNPTSGTDPGEVFAYPVGTNPDYNYRGFDYDFGQSHSPDGMIQYSGNAFNGALDGKLMVVRYSGGADIMTLTLDASGNVTQTSSNIAGLSGFVNPVDLTEDTRTGNLYIADYGAGTLVLARPIVPGAHANLNQTTFQFNDDYANNNTTASPTQTLRITNTGTQPLSIPATGLVLSDTTNWVFTSKPNLPAVIPPGGYVDIGIAFKAASAGGAGIRTATLTITSNDQAQPSITVNLRGLATAGTGGQNEPSLQRIFDLYQLGINTGDSNPADANLFSPSEPLNAVNDEVTVQRLIKAGPGNVTIEPLATFAGGSPAVNFGYYTAGTPSAQTLLFNVASADAQTVHPTLNGTTSFDPGSGAFGLYATFPIFKNTAYSEDSLNTTENTLANRRKVRFYALKDASGNVVPNAYVFTTEDYINDPSGGYDTNDFVGIIRNVQALPDGGQIGLQNIDGAPTVNRLVFNRIQIEPPDPVKNADGSITQPPNNVVHDTAKVRVLNTGNAPLTINSLALNSNGWQLIDPPAAGTQIAPGGYLDVAIKFVAQGRQPGSTGNQTEGTNAAAGGAWSGTLTINSDSVSQSSTTVQLAGWWQLKSENNYEPNLQTLVNNIYGYSTTTLNPDQQMDAGNARGQVATIGEEVLSRYWVRADTNYQVSVQQLAAYHTQGNTATLKWYTKSTNVGSFLFTQEGLEGQSLLPHTDAGLTSLAKGSFTPTMGTNNPNAAFQFRIDSEWSDDTMNSVVASNPNDQGHHVRFFPARDAKGNLIPNTWLMVMDYQGINYDYQDNVYVVTNMKPDAPSAPTNLIAQAQGPAIALSWTPPDASKNPLVSGYNIYRSTTATGTYTKIASAVTTASYQDPSAAAGTTYYYKVSAINNWNGESAQSGSASAQRSADTTPPAIPTGLSATPAASGIQLAWTANTEIDLAGYKIYRSDTASGTYLVLNSGQLVTSAGYTDSTVAQGKTQYYEISAVDMSGNESPLSSFVSGQRSADTTPPAIPTGLTAQGLSSGIQLNWTANSDVDLAGYRIYRSDSQTGTYLVLNSGQLVTSAAYSDTTAPASKAMYYEVTAVDLSGNESALSSFASGTRQDTTPPAIPSGLSATGQTGAISLAWTAVTDPDLAGYRIYRANSATGTFSALNGGALATSSRFTDNTVSAGATWYYRITAVDTSGNESAPSTVASGTVPSASAVTVRINVGGGAYTDASGNLWAADNGATGGTVTVNGNYDVQKTTDDPLYYTRRWGPMSYKLSVPDGTYTLNLYFADPLYTTAGKRIFNVSANGSSILSNFDIAASGGGKSALVETFTVNVTGGSGLTLAFTNGSVENAILSAIELLGSANATQPDTTPPAVPVGFNATGSSSGAILGWTANAEPDLAGYNVYRSQTQSGSYARLNTSGLVTSTAYTDPSAGQGTWYYRLTAVDTSGNESEAATASAAVPMSTDTTPPASPTKPLAKGAIGGMNVSWDAPGDADLAGYYIYRSSSYSSGYVLLNSTLVTSTSYFDNSAPTGRSYYRIVAVDVSGNVSAPAVISGTRY